MTTSVVSRIAKKDHDERTIWLGLRREKKEEKEGPGDGVGLRVLAKRGRGQVT